MEAVDRFFAKYVFGFLATEIMRFGVSKYSVYNHGWLFAMFAVIYSMSSWPSGLYTWVFGTLAMLVTINFLIRTAMNPDSAHANPLLFWRIMWLALTLFDIIMIVVEGWSAIKVHDWVINICILTAEYALLIDKIPPRKTKEKKVILSEKVA